MALNFRNIKKWWKMVKGESILHVNQGIGKSYSFECVKGYYNDLTEKVTKDEANFHRSEIINYDKNKSPFPIAVFQYGLACYDLYLQNHPEKSFLFDKFLLHVKWTADSQNEDGSWTTFGDQYSNYPFSAMAQGEGCSLLIRGYLATGNQIYLSKAKKALEFMLKPLARGGTAIEDDERLTLFEFTCFPCVFNGWIFAIFGMMDYVICTQDSTIKKSLDKTLDTLSRNLKLMDNGYWSRYRNDNTIASPFYHRLHIAQLKLLYEYTEKKPFLYYAELFERRESNFLCRSVAFVAKAFQKIIRSERPKSKSFCDKKQTRIL